MTTPEVITQYAPLRAVLALLPRVARGGDPVTIRGEVGSGKSVIARTIHQLSGRRAAIAEVDCTAGGEAQLREVLFGAQEGTGGEAAHRARGAVGLAAGGTLVLHEIGALPLSLQDELVRVLGRQRTGADPAGLPATRLIATTSRPPRARDAPETPERLRPELQARLAGISIELPPLRDRVVDIPLLAEHFAKRHGAVASSRLTPEVLASLERYDWPGNVRELRVVIDRIAADGGAAVPASAGLPVIGAPLPLTEVERQHIEGVLARTGWHQGRAAELLGISAKTLYRKIREYGLHHPRR